MRVLVGTIVPLLLFAWAARALLSARDLTWTRTLLAGVVGWTLGLLIAGLLIADPADLLAADVGEIQFVAIPFQLVAAMVAVVALELLSGRPPRRGRGRRRPVLALRRGGTIVRRGAQVSRIAARWGLAPLVGLRRRGAPSPRSPEQLARHVREALEAAGGMFVKLGQLLATRPDLLPPAAVTELGRLHGSAAPLERAAVEDALAREIGGPVEERFARFDWTPIGSASIAQAHTACLHDGREVVVKLRRPGLDRVVERDLVIVAWLAGLAERRTAWGRRYGARALASEFADTLRRELDFTVEARFAQEAADATDDHPAIVVPTIVTELTTSALLVMERLVGSTLAEADGALPDEQARDLADALCSSQLQAMLRGQRFHGDPHPGNVLLTSDGRVGLIDFGITGRLDSFERASVHQMLVALHLEEPALLREALVEVGALSAAGDVDRVERALARYMAAYLGPGLPPAEAFTDLLRLTTELGVTLPPSTATMFRALATLSGTLEQLSPGYPLIDAVAAVGGTELQQRLTPASMSELVQHEWASLAPLLRRAPRHLDRLASIIEHDGLPTRLRLFADPDDRRVVFALVNRLALTVIGLGLALISVVMLGTADGPMLDVMDVALLDVLGWFGLFAGVVLILRVVLAALRDERPPRPLP